ncbi:MAG: hypothetical protein GY759_00470 [Chloroflexi bacterium]|nr:hypothetical protein [Chloroflexota bacterium]
MSPTIWSISSSVCPFCSVRCGLLVAGS